jgi:hypothetical protein
VSGKEAGVVVVVAIKNKLERKFLFLFAWLA